MTTVEILQQNQQSGDLPSNSGKEIVFITPGQKILGPPQALLNTPLKPFAQA